MKKQGFSLVEMLVAMAIFSAVAIVMASILNNVAGAGRRDEGRVATASAFRTASDRLTADWNSASLHLSHPPMFEKLLGNDRLHFFSHVRTPRAGSDPPRLARISYRVEPAEALVREIVPIGWDDLISDAQPPATGSVAAFIEECGVGIFRAEIAFQDREGRLTAAPPASPSDLKALVVAFAALEPDAMARLNDIQKAALEGALPDGEDEDRMPGEAWGPELFEELPPYVRENVRFYQRWFLFQ